MIISKKTLSIITIFSDSDSRDTFKWIFNELKETMCQLVMHRNYESGLGKQQTEMIVLKSMIVKKKKENLNGRSQEQNNNC